MHTISLSLGLLVRRVPPRFRTAPPPLPAWLREVIDDARAGRNVVHMTLEELRAHVGLDPR